MVWCFNNIPHPVLPPLTNYGWKEEGKQLEPVQSRDPPAPATVTHLNVVARRPIVGHIVPVGRKASTVLRCVGAEMMKRLAVISTKLF